MKSGVDVASQGADKVKQVLSVCLLLQYCHQEFFGGCASTEAWGNTA